MKSQLPAPSHEGGEYGGKEQAGLAIAPALLLFIPSGFLPPPASRRAPHRFTVWLCIQGLSFSSSALVEGQESKAKPMGVRWGRLKAPE